MAQDFAAFARKLDRASAEFTGANKAAILRQLGEAGQRDAAKAVNADLHGPKFPHWAPPLTTEIKVGTDEVIVRAAGKAKGPWRVAQDGRHAGQFGPMQGPGLGGLSKKTGRALKGRKQGKWNGQTQPKDTWSDAVEIMKTEHPKRAARASSAALGKVFGR